MIKTSNAQRKTKRNITSWGNILKLLSGYLLVVLLMFGCGQEQKPEPPPPLVPAIRIAGVDDFTVRSFPGIARAGKEVNLSFRVTGPLVELPVGVGSKVEKGDVVARIDPQDYTTALGTVTGQLQRAEAAATRASGDYRRIQNVFKEDPGATSESAVDLALASRDSTAATVRSLQSAVETARDKVRYTSLLAPFSGIVVETYVENFETVLSKQPILRLLDPSSIEFVVSVPENLISYAPYVESVMVTFDALPGVQVEATISEIGKEATQATRTYPVTLLMDQPDGSEILPGMAGTAKVSGKLPETAREAGLQLPASAIFTKVGTNKSYVWVIDEASKILKSREVETGRLTDRGILIRSGISPGELIAVRGVNSVTEGQKVRILDVSGKEG